MTAPEMVELHSTFCPNGDDHWIAHEVVLPMDPSAPPATLIDYLIRCGACRFYGIVHAEKRWRRSGDYGGTVYRYPEEVGR